MLLKRLELLGFKSFASRSVFDFDEGISVLVGPNGSGKSNVADAVRWVLGEQSSRALRGRRSEDVIFVGSTSRGPLGMAEVALVLDNTERNVALDFSEVRLVRRLYRSGESEYLVNGARSRRRDLVSLLLSVGLHTDGYTVIGQGAVDELVLQRPEERRAVLEHAADIARHQVRLAEARSRLESTSHNLTRCLDLVAELEPQARRLRGQAERAERYATRRAELAGLAGVYFRVAMHEQQRVVDEREVTLVRASAACETIELAIAAQETERRRCRDELARLDEQSAELSAELERLHRLREQQLSNVASARQRIGFFEARAEMLAGDLARIDGDSAALDGEPIAASQAGELSGESEARELFDRLECDVEQLAVDLRATRQQLDRTRSDKLRLDRERERLELRINADLERAERERRQEAETAARRSALEARLLDIREDLNGLRSQQHVVSSALAVATEQLREATTRAHSVRERLSELRRGEQRLSGEIEALRASSRALLGEAALGAAGGSQDAGGADLLLGATHRIPAEFEHGLAAALGEWAWARVRESGSLETMPPHDQPGRSLFVDVDAGFPASIADDDFAAVAAEMSNDVWLQSAREILGGIGRVLGPLRYTLVVRNLADARLVAQRLGSCSPVPWLVATLSGQVLTYFGGLACGAESAAERLVSVQRRAGELGARLDELQREHASLAQSCQDAEDAAILAEEHERAERAAELTQRATASALDRRETELGAELERLEAQLHSLPATVVSQSTAVAADAADQRRSLQNQSAALIERESVDLARLRSLQEAWEAIRAQRDDARSRVNDFEARRRAQKEALERRERQRSALGERRRTALEEHRTITTELDAARSHVGDQEASLRESGTALGEIGQRLEQLAVRRTEQRSAADEVDRELARLRRERAEAQSARETALLARQQAADELQRVTAEAETVAEEWGLGSEGLVQLRLPGQTERTVEMPVVPAPPDIDLATARRRLQSLQRELRASGTAGEGVLEEFHEVEERLGFLRTQAADLQGAMAEIEIVVADLQSLMRQGFTTAFERVNEELKSTFSTLFGGGTARLILTDPTDPLHTGVEIEAQPPGKRLQNMMSLSGGERALTSTALIFALLAINPIPFCVLDEVDAALDESNARRFATLLQQFSSRTQFIIITHNRATMEIGRSLYGISMAADGVTTVASLRPSEAVADVQNRNGQVNHGSQPAVQAR